jgi:ribosomal protein S18 acetylase RimI-like enzyme
VVDATEMDTFTGVQVAGFGSSGAELPKWKGWLGEFNHKNLAHPDQSFYIGRLDGKPAGVTLLLITGEIAGIYAVATLPEYRKKGVSTALLNRAVGDARARGCTVISLQVSQGSYAQKLYRSLGFENVFDSPIFVRKENP